MATPNIEGRVWRSGKPQGGFDFDDISGYLDHDETLVWVDFCDPDHDTLRGLADELGLNHWAVEDAVAAAERVKVTPYATQTFFTVYAVDVVADADENAPRMLSMHRLSAFVLPRGLIETNLSLRDARLNTVMKKLTGWAAIIAVPTAITGFYGQNVPYPGFGTIAGFAASTTVILVLMVVLYVMFRRRDWL